MSLPSDPTIESPTSTTNTPSTVPPEAPRKRTSLLLFVAVALLLLIVAGTGGALLYLRWAKKPYATTGKPVRIQVAPGASAATIGQELEAKRIIRSARIFTMDAKGATIHPGLYDFSPSESPARIASRLASGDVVKIRVTFPEGFTVRQIARRLARNGLCDEATFYDLITKHGSTLKASFTPPDNLEGYLFPDTYRFPLGSSATNLAERMLDDFDTVVIKAKATDIQKSGHTLHEILTVAAMVEREAEVDKDRPLIAGVIYNRIKRRMPLQIDATVQYALPEHKARLLYSDLRIDSPYNTYRFVGLPPGPICCPGSASIDAALHPATHDYLFYVARPDRSHAFARTLAEHNRNIALIRHKR